MNQTLGEKLSPILEEIEITLWEKDAKDPGLYGFTPPGRRAGIKIFSAILADMMWEKQKDDPLKWKKLTSGLLGDDIRALIKKYTDIDTKDLYK